MPLQNLSGRPAQAHQVIRSTCPQACEGAHGTAVLSNWGDFEALEPGKMHTSTVPSACVFSGCELLDHTKLRGSGYTVYALGKPLGPSYSAADCSVQALWVRGPATIAGWRVAQLQSGGCRAPCHGLPRPQPSRSTVLIQCVASLCARHIVFVRAATAH